jgi:hypothetical protein
MEWAGYAAGMEEMKNKFIQNLNVEAEREESTSEP